MFNKYKAYLYFAMGVVSVLLLFWVFGKFKNVANKTETSDYYILTNQISKMNKMVVLEQDFTTTNKSKVAYQLLGATISNNEVVTFTKTNAQVSYDLNKMKLKVDSVNKKLIIEALPQPDIRIVPNVEIKSMDDSFFNRVNEAQLKKITQESKEYALKQIDENKLKEEGKKQLLENLDQIFVLAKALHYAVEDKTGSFRLSEL